MKEKVIQIGIGVLIGVVITTAGFLIGGKAKRHDDFRNRPQTEMNDERPGDRNSSNKGGIDSKDNQRPSRQNDSNKDKSDEKAPEKSEENKSDNSSTTTQKNT